MSAPQQRQHQRVIVTLMSLIISIVAVGCAGTTTLEQSWSAPRAPNAAFQRVVTLYISNVGAISRSAEDRLAQRLASQGVHAVPAYAVLSDQDRNDLERAKATLRAAGFDGLVVMRVVDLERRIESAPSVDSAWGSAWGGYWDMGPYYTPYYYTEVIVRIETDAYSLPDNQLVWSGLSRTVDAEDTQQLVEGVTKVVANELGKRGVVVASRKPNAPREPAARL